jgi:hypothetical protein
MQRDRVSAFGVDDRLQLAPCVSHLGLSNRRAEASGQMRLGVRTEAPKSGNDLHPMSDIAG